MVTPEQCVDLAHQHGQIILHPLMGGLSPDLAWAGLRLFETKVLPRIR